MYIHTEKGRRRRERHDKIYFVDALFTLMFYLRVNKIFLFSGDESKMNGCVFEGTAVIITIIIMIIIIFMSLKEETVLSEILKGLTMKNYFMKIDVNLICFVVDFGTKIIQTLLF